MADFAHHHDGRALHAGHSHDLDGVGISEGDPAFALLLSLLAGLATTIGAAIAFYANTDDNCVYAICLGLSAGVMVYVSFSEIMDMTTQSFRDANLTESSAFLLGTLVTFAGILVAVAVDWLGHCILKRCYGGASAETVVVSDAPAPQVTASQKRLNGTERLHMSRKLAIARLEFFLL